MEFKFTFELHPKPFAEGPQSSRQQKAYLFEPKELFLLYFLFWFKLKRKLFSSFFHRETESKELFTKNPILSPILFKWIKVKVAPLLSHNLWKVDISGPSLDNLYNKLAFIFLFGFIQFFKIELCELLSKIILSKLVGDRTYYMLTILIFIFIIKF